MRISNPLNKLKKIPYEKCINNNVTALFSLLLMFIILFCL